MCWKWTSFASRHDWTRRTIFWKFLASMSAVTAWISFIMFAFKASMVRGLFSQTLPFRYPHKKYAVGVSSRERCGQSPFELKRSSMKKNRCSVSQQLGTLQTHTTDTFLFISHTRNVLLFKFRCNIFIGVTIIEEMLGSVAIGTLCIRKLIRECFCKCDFSKEQCSSLKMIFGSKQVGVILESNQWVFLKMWL